MHISQLFYDTDVTITMNCFTLDVLRTCVMDPTEHAYEYDFSAPQSADATCLSLTNVCPAV